MAFFSYGVLKPNKNFTFTYAIKNCPSCTGTSIYKNLTKKEYLDVTTRTLKWITDKKALPNYTSFKNYKISVKLNIFALAKIIVFYDKYGKLPNTCWYASDVFGAKPVVKGDLCNKLTKLTGVSVTDYKTLYKAMSKFKYDYYYEDKQTQSRTLSRMAGNCVDLNQVEYKALLEIYSSDKVQIVRGTVRCSDGGVYGHVWCRIKVSGAWLNVDASASARGKAIGTVICPSVVSITNINPSWAVNDTGDA